MKSNKPLLHDKQIINRVKLYLEQNVDQTNVNVGRMTRDLMRRYPDYHRRKFAPFCKLVLEAFHIISKSYGLDQKNTYSAAGESNVDLIPVREEPRNNLMSGMMNTLYNKPKADGLPKSVPPESINILSSDESDSETPKANGNGMNADGNGGGVAAIGPLPRVDAAPAVAVSVSGIAQKRTANFGPNQNTKKLKLDQPTIPPNVQNSRTGHEAHRKQQIHGTMYNDNSDEDSASNVSLGSRLRRANRAYKKEITVRKPEHRFEEIGGMESTLKELCELLINIKSPDIYFQLGLLPPRGILLHGPTGCGKNLLAEAIAGQLRLPFIEVAATELIAGVSGESEERIRDIFEQAADCSPCVLFIDEIDTISSNRSMAQKDMERRVVSQLISSLDDLKNSDGGQSVLVIGATTRPDVLDPALRRFGRFDHEIQISIPSRKGRKDILMILSRGMSIETGLDFDKIAELTPGYVGADLLALLTRAASIAVKRKCTQNFRNLEAKATRIMDIVELDDDENESTLTKNASNAAETPESVTKPDEDKNDNKNSPKPESSNDQNAEAEAKKTTDKTNEVNNMEVDVDVDDGNKEGKEQDKEEEKGKELQSSEEGKVDTANKDDKEDEESATNEVHEPTLLQLTNWLENPPDELSDPDFCITFADFVAAVKVVQPSAKREGFITVPDVTWDDIGSLQDIRDELKLAVLAPVKYPERLARLGLTTPSGVLLCGPPGCGKTLLAKAIANEAGINFISVKGPELMNMYVGESERAVRACFQRARNSAPCVIFFDEFDSLCPKRSDGNESGSGTRIVNQLLTEMDGVEDRKGVYILAATNRPDIIDPAILRPGRLDTILYVGLPQEKDREEILKATTKNGTRPNLADDVELSALAAKTDGYTGADLAGLVKQASMLALRASLIDPEQKLEDLCVRKKDFEAAIVSFRPSVSTQDRKVYEKLREKYAAPRTDNTN